MKETPARVVPASELLAGERRARKSSELVARDLASYIVDHDLPEGTRLPPEREMGAALGVGRTTLREALRLLETRGALSIRPGRQGGPIVRRPKPEDLSEVLTLILQFQQASLSDVIEVRMAIEPTVARLAAARIKPEELDELRGTIDRMRTESDDSSLFRRENQVFHATIARASGNVVLATLNESLKLINDGAVVGVEYTLRRRRAVAAAHARIVDALGAGDGDAAEVAMRDHLTEAGHHWKSKYAGLFGVAVRWSD